jgi:glycosyltransferase involved in cell wall biosynthesis
VNTLGSEYDITVVKFAPQEPFFKIDPLVKIITVPIYGVNPGKGIFTKLYYGIKQNLLRIKELRHVIKTVSPAVVLSFMEESNIVTLLSSFNLKIPVVITEHSVPRLNSRGWIWRFLSKRLYRLASAMVIPSSSLTLPCIEDFGVFPRVIPNLVTLVNRKEEGELKGNESFIIVTAGRLSNEKGFDQLINACSLLDEDLKKRLEVRIFGEGVDNDKLRVLASNSGLKIHLMGESRELFRELCQGNLFVSPSRYEGFGNVILEAICAGLPVIAFDAPVGARTILGDSEFGELIEPGNIKELSNVISQAMSDVSYLQNLLERSRKRYLLLQSSQDEILTKWRILIESLPNGIETEKPRLVVVSTLQGGGAERVMATIANGWSKFHDTLLLTFDGEKSTPHYVIDPQVRLIRLGVWGKTSSFLEALLGNYHRFSALQKAIRAAKPEVILSALPRTNIIILLVTLFKRVKVIVTEHSVPNRSSIGWLWSILRSLTYPLAGAVVVPSNELQKAIKAWVGVDPKVIPNPALFKESPTLNKRGTTTFKIIGVGRLAPVKDFSLLIKAFSIVKSSVPDSELTIFGEGEERAKLSELANELNVKVNFPGFASAIYDEYQNADMFVLTSQHEAFPVALLEAMAAGLPVVSVDCEVGPRSIIRDKVDGILVSSRSPEVLAEHILEVISDSSLRKRIAKEATSVRERFGLQRVLQQWEDLIHQCA